jgi:hypothetical protein
LLTIRRFSWYLGAVLLSVAFGAWVGRGTVELWPLFAASVVLGLVGWAVDTAPVRRLTGRPTRETQFNRVYDEINSIREELHEALELGRGLDRSAWEHRVLALDAAFWQWVLAYYTGRERTLRSNLTDLPDLLARYRGDDDRDWATIMRTQLLARKVAMDSFSEETP